MTLMISLRFTAGPMYHLSSAKSSQPFMIPSRWFYMEMNTLTLKGRQQVDKTLKDGEKWVRMLTSLFLGRVKCFSGHSTLTN